MKILAARSNALPLTVTVLALAALLAASGCREPQPDPHGRPSAPLGQADGDGDAGAVDETGAAPADEAERRDADQWREAEAGADGRRDEDVLGDRLDPIYFDFDRSAIRPDQQAVMEANARWLRDHPDVRVLVEGHCDERGTREYNLALGDRRANSARQFLISLGIDPSRIDTISYGEERPADPGHNETAWARNRRAEFLVIDE